MEAALVNTLSCGDKALVLHAGQFGARWMDLCKAYGINAISVERPWGAAIDPNLVAEKLKSHPDVCAVFATQSETATGVLHDIKSIGDAVRKTDALFIVDGVSSVVAHPLCMDEWGVDIAVTASQKGLMVPPGIGVISVGPRAWTASEKSDLPTFYFDLPAYRTSLEEGRGPATLPVTLLAGLEAALGLLNEEGIETVWSRHARHALAVRQAALALGLEIFAESPSNALTAIQLPDSVDGVALMDCLRTNHGVIIGGGLAHLRGKIIRIANLGYMDDLDILTALSALELSLQSLGWEFASGAGVSAGEKALVETQH